ncbi:hypothetical protein CLCR_04351 [Cladophialophora carrionii]|uniref:Uncharacterized protein n=1 Tax=Cladophialophora carrionii TaxID=86049 RepID=A0A1C1CJB5_9EURO|nr:hypothetical protein CLCR_04351 [Cladophialophora carrionii]
MNMKVVKCKLIDAGYYVCDDVTVIMSAGGSTDKDFKKMCSGRRTGQTTWHYCENNTTHDNPGMMTNDPMMRAQYGLDLVFSVHALFVEEGYEVHRPQNAPERAMVLLLVLVLVLDRAEDGDIEVYIASNSQQQGKNNGDLNEHYRCDGGGGDDGDKLRGCAECILFSLRLQHVCISPLPGWLVFPN